MQIKFLVSVVTIFLFTHTVNVETMPPSSISDLVGCYLQKMTGIRILKNPSHTLKPLNLDPHSITVSGVSSGGTMAQQVFVSHSTKIAGVGVFSHSFYRCGPGDGVLTNYDATCTLMGEEKEVEPWPAETAIDDILFYQKRNLIDNPANMIGKKLYVFAGTENYLFSPEMSLQAVEVFKPFIKEKKSIRTRVVEANLTLPSNRVDVELPRCELPPKNESVSYCGFSGALDCLRHLLSYQLHLQEPPPIKGRKLQPLIEFDQTEFFTFKSNAKEYSLLDKSIGRPKRIDMDTVGYIYIPSKCRGKNRKKCLLHFYFHGCLSGREFVGDKHITLSGFLEIAELNGIVVVFPQAKSSQENKIGCWDTFGLTGKLYATKYGAQVRVVKAMMDRLLLKR